MADHIDPNLKAAVERLVRERFPDTVLDRILIEEAVDEDGDDIVKVMVLLKERPDVSRVRGLTRRMWSDLSRQKFGFPILSFRTTEENARLIAAA